MLNRDNKNLKGKNCYFNPKRAGGGGAESAPPSTFRAIILWKFFSAPRAFMTFFFQVLRNFCAIFGKIGRTVPKLRNIM